MLGCGNISLLYLSKASVKSGPGGIAVRNWNPLTSMLSLLLPCFHSAGCGTITGSPRPLLDEKASSDVDPCPKIGKFQAPAIKQRHIKLERSLAPQHFPEAIEFVVHSISLIPIPSLLKETIRCNLCIQACLCIAAKAQPLFPSDSSSVAVWSNSFSKFKQAG
jgi:hypothetical protein